MSAGTGYNAGGGGGDSFAIIRDTAASRVDSTDLVADDVLKFTAGPNEKWACHLHLVLNGGSPEGIQFEIAVPSGASGWIANPGFDTALAGAYDLAETRLIATPSATPQQRTADLFFDVRTGGTGGEVAFTWGQAVASGTGNSIEGGSFLKGTKES